MNLIGVFFFVTVRTDHLLTLYINRYNRQSSTNDLILRLVCWPMSLYPRNEVRGGGVYWIHPVCLSVCPSVCLLPFRVRPVASTVQDGFFPYLVQMITSIRRCVACDDLWPWLRKSCPLCSVYSSGWSLSIFSTNDHYYFRVCRVLCFFQNLKIWIFGKFLKFFGLDFEKKNLQFSMDSFHI